jgi:hypothetical protein
MASPPSRLIRFRGLDARWIDITDYDLRAVVRKAKRGSTTNPGAAACNERNLASEIQFIFVRCHSSLLYWLRRMPGFAFLTICYSCPRFLKASSITLEKEKRGRHRTLVLPDTSF